MFEEVVRRGGSPKRKSKKQLMIHMPTERGLLFSYPLFFHIGCNFFPVILPITRTLNFTRLKMAGRVFEKKSHFALSRLVRSQ